MSVRMRALRGFIGRSGEGVGRDGVKAGEEFNAASDRRADELENRPKPLAIRLDSTPKQRKLAVPPKTEASETGPLSTTGGEPGGGQPDRKRGRQGKSGAGRLDHGCRHHIKKKQREYR